MRIHKVLVAIVASVAACRVAEVLLYALGPGGRGLATCGAVFVFGVISVRRGAISWATAGAILCALGFAVPLIWIVICSAGVLFLLRCGRRGAWQRAALIDGWISGLSVVAFGVALPLGLSLACWCFFLTQAGIWVVLEVRELLTPEMMTSKVTQFESAYHCATQALRRMG